MHLAVYEGESDKEKMPLVLLPRHHGPATIANLPEEILTMIFAGLNINDMFSVVDVCVHWRDACAAGRIPLQLEADLRQLALPPEKVSTTIEAMATCFSHLVKLDATGTDIGDTELGSIRLLSRLTSLDLSGCDRDHGHGAPSRCSTHAAHHPELEWL